MRLSCSYGVTTRPVTRRVPQSHSLFHVSLKKHSNATYVQLGFPQLFNVTFFVCVF